MDMVTLLSWIYAQPSQFLQNISMSPDRSKASDSKPEIFTPLLHPCFDLRNFEEDASFPFYYGPDFIDRNIVSIPDKRLRRKHICLTTSLDGSTILFVEGTNPYSSLSSSSLSCGMLLLFDNFQQTKMQSGIDVLFRRRAFHRQFGCASKNIREC